ncbi:hypothetical protein ACIP88_00130 [Streptomyces uncialis]|uniref:hypothetical protein n=1 Tax=Streptomyces uncialis TaxID=1048205 RepID=UPI00380C4DB5
MAFMRYKTTGFSWAVAYPAGEWKVLFGRGTEAALISQQGLVASGQLSGIEAKLNGRSEGYRRYSEGALMLPVDNGSWSTLFFQDDRYERYHWDQGIKGEGQWSGQESWAANLPAWYSSQVDALLQAPSAANGQWQTYFFKGPWVLTMNWTTGVVRERLITEGPDESGADGWTALPEGFRGDFDHVVAYRPAADGTRQTLLIKGAQGLILNWRTGVVAQGALNALGVPGLAALPAPYRTPYRSVNGRWTGTVGDQRVELRVDLEGEYSFSAVSGDLFTVSGTTTTYSESFRAPQLSVDQGADQYAISQSGIEYPGPSPRSTLRLTIPRVASDAPAQQATLRLEAPDGTQSRVFPCTYGGPGLRAVELETDSMAGTAVFGQYDTSRGATPADYRDRILTVASAYAEAGIELVGAGTVNTVADASAGTDLKWSTAELHAAMENNFSLHRDAAQWKLWNFVATRHTDNLFGIMFDQQGSHRQGVAVFHGALADHGALGTPDELFTYVHELGHAFNLTHSWQKRWASPPAPLGDSYGYGELSWMNYPHYYIGGAGRGSAHFWPDFPFRFSADELYHLRHGFYRYIVPGGNNFMANAALEAASGSLEAFSPPVVDESGLALTLGGKDTFAHGEPVMAEVRLTRNGPDGEVAVAGNIGAHSERTTFAITDPTGRTQVFRPLAQHCGGHGPAEATVTLTDRQPAVYATAYLGYGSGGLYFAEPGLYRITAVHHTLDGSRVVSPTRTLRVRAPLDRADQEVGELLTGTEQGTLLALLGSDAPQLAAGNDALQEIIERHGRHPLAAYARLARGANAGRHFQRIGDSRIEIRQPDTKESITQLTHAITVSRTDQDTGLDNLTLNAAMRRLARVHAKAGDLERAETVLDDLVTHFQDQGVPGPVQAEIQRQAEEVRTEVREAAEG